MRGMYILLFSSLLLVACSSEGGSPNTFASQLNLSEIEFEQTELNEKDIFNSKLNGQLPSHYKINGNGILHVYHFSNSQTVKKAKNEFSKLTARYDMGSHKNIIAGTWLVIYEYREEPDPEVINAIHRLAEN